MDEIWKGHENPPGSLADEVENARSQFLSGPGVEPLEVVTITVSAANRALIVAALRAYEPRH